MMPGSLVALTIMVALIPGFLFLKLTNGVRRPSEQTPLQELAEVLAVGLVTSGLTTGAILLVWPNEVVDLIRTRSQSAGDLRDQVLAAAGALGASCLMSVLAAALRNRLTVGKRYAPNVWEVVFGVEKAGHARHVVFELLDGRSFDGPLRAYTVSPAADGARQLAIWGDIRVTQPGAGEAPQATVYDFVVVDASAIKFAAMTHVAHGECN